MGAGTCPHCQNMVRSISVNNVDVKVNGVVRWRGATFACGSCNAVLSAGIDPIAIKTDIVKEIKGK